MEPLSYGLELRYQEPNQLEAVAFWLHNNTLRWSPFIIIACVAAPNLACLVWLLRRWLLGSRQAGGPAALASWAAVLAASWATIVVVMLVFRRASFSGSYALATAA